MDSLEKKSSHTSTDILYCKKFKYFSGFQFISGYSMCDNKESTIIMFK